MEDNICSEIIEKYYRAIYAYCFTQLDYSKFAADDCTQEVFLTLLKKKERLYLSDNIKFWLYRTADNVIKSYRRKNSRISDVDINDADIPVKNDFEVTYEESESVLEKLSDEELKLVKAYYSSQQGDKEAVARRFGMNLKQLYKAIHKIKLKLRE